MQNSLETHKFEARSALIHLYIPPNVRVRMRPMNQLMGQNVFRPILLERRS